MTYLRLFIFSVFLIYAITIIMLMVSVKAHAGSCNQSMYDTIYKKIIGLTLSRDLSEQALSDRNNAIRILRVLCNNQVSTWELYNNMHYQPRSVR